MDTTIFVSLTVIAGVVFLMLYGLALQKKAVGTQDKGMEHIQRSLKMQEKSVQLNEETNALLRELLAKLPTKESPGM